MANRFLSSKCQGYLAIICGLCQNVFEVWWKIEGERIKQNLSLLASISTKFYLKRKN